MAHVVMIEPNSNDGSLLIPEKDPLLSVEDVAGQLNVSRDWVWDHSSQKPRYNLAIHMSAEHNFGMPLPDSLPDYRLVRSVRNRS
jgi:hypothetical protein